MKNKSIKIVIIGGGAAGLAAAVSCGERFGRGNTAIIEKQPRTGRKRRNNYRRRRGGALRGGSDKAQKSRFIDKTA